MWWSKKAKPDPLKLARNLAKEEQKKLDNAYERLKEVLKETAKGEVSK